MLEIDPETERKNIRFALALAATALLLFGGTIAVAFIYLAVV